MKVVLDLSPRALTFLKSKAKKVKRSRKNYMELVLTVHAAQIEPQPNIELKSSNKK